MLKVGDTVKIIAATEDAGYCDGRKIEYIPIGTICTVVETDIEADGSQSCAVDCGDGYAYWYKANELKKAIWNGLKTNRRKGYTNKKNFNFNQKKENGTRMLDTHSIDTALSEVRRVKENFDTKQGYVNREDYKKLCHCEHDLLGARDVINMINRGDFDKYYSE